eukprot:TCONS_00031763-protein
MNNPPPKPIFLSKYKNFFHEQSSSKTYFPLKIQKLFSRTILLQNLFSSQNTKTFFTKNPPPKPIFLSKYKNIFHEKSSSKTYFPLKIHNHKSNPYCLKYKKNHAHTKIQ